MGGPRPPGTVVTLDGRPVVRRRGRHHVPMLDGVRLSRERAKATLRRTLEILRDVVAQNERLAEVPGHRESAERRVAEGKQEIRTAEAELAALEAEERP
jgi:hypothetical protein